MHFGLAELYLYFIAKCVFGPYPGADRNHRRCLLTGSTGMLTEALERSADRSTGTDC